MRLWKYFSGVSLLLFSFFLAGCGGQQTSYKINLEIWGVFDDSDAFSSIFDEYREINPFIGQITYRKLSPETYKEDILSALASGKGPDMFLIQNTWMPAFQDKVVPASDSLLLEKDFRDALVDVAANDLIGPDNKIYGIPIAMDSLALYYNKDLFNAAGVTEPPKTWEDFLALIPRLKQVDQYGNIKPAAAALGTAYNINRSTDILLALASQEGSSLEASRLNDDGMQKAMDFYTRFAQSSSPFYTWNTRLHNSLDAFGEGNTAMMLNYSWQYSVLKQKNPKLNFAVAPMPQFANSQPSNIANYWTFVVAKNKSEPVANSMSGTVSYPAGQYQNLRVYESWEFLKYLAMPHPSKKFTVHNPLSGNDKEFPLKRDPSLAYLTATKQPAARRDLIETEKSDVFLAPFALGNLFARSWQPKNAEAAETAIAQAIDSVNKGELSVRDAVATIGSRVAR